MHYRAKKKKEHKYNTKENHQATMKETQRRRKRIENNYSNKQKASNKIAISAQLSIITLNVDGLNIQSKDLQWLIG